MLSMLLIGVATALLICAITAKVLLGAHKKANKSEKAEIMKQLLALSDGGNRSAHATSSSARSRPSSRQATLPSNGPRKTTTRITQTLRTQ